MPPKFIAQQLSNPSGFSSYFIGRMMNHRNARMNAFAVEQLELCPSDRVLEIGFGGGVSLPLILADAAYVAGLDRSPDVVKAANSRFQDEVERDRAEFKIGCAEAIPYEPGYFQKACTVNTVYFFRDLGPAFREIFRVLAPGGRVAIGFLPKKCMDQMNFPADVFTSRTPEEVADALSNAGFSRIRSALPATPAAWNVIVAER